MAAASLTGVGIFCLSSSNSGKLVLRRRSPNHHHRVPRMAAVALDEKQETFTLEKSEQAFSAAKELMPGGVNSPVRAFKSVGGQPIVMDSVKGSRMRDIDGNEYIDYVGSWGPAIIGHADDEGSGIGSLNLLSMALSPY